jgi:hypothetical protein
MEPFAAPPYIKDLIAAINDGAKSAQLGALAFTAIGLFLLATAFSATDEDLLLNRALTISQLGGTAVPVVFAFGLAPAVFVAAHFYTLIRYDTLTDNVWRFREDLGQPGSGSVRGPGGDPKFFRGAALSRVTHDQRVRPPSCSGINPLAGWRCRGSHAFRDAPCKVRRSDVSFDAVALAAAWYRTTSNPQFVGRVARPSGGSSPFWDWTSWATAH